MVDIERKIKDLLKKSELIPKEDLKQLLENTRKKIISIFLDFIFKNNLEIYNKKKNNFKDIIKKNIDEINIEDKLLSKLNKCKIFSINYKNDVLRIIKVFSDNLCNSVIFYYNYEFFINENIIGVNFLFHYTYSKECLTFIRQVSDLRDIDFSYLNKTVNLIYNYFQNFFRYSRRLMIYMFVDNIFRNKILQNLEKNIFYSRLSVVGNIDSYSDELFLKIIYKNGSEIKKLIASNTKNSINSGLILK